MKSNLILALMIAATIALYAWLFQQWGAKELLRLAASARPKLRK